MNWFNRPIGLCLSGGGAKGLCHIGVLKTLESLNKKIGAITGTSIGALIGGMYAYEQDLQSIEDYALNITKKEWTKLFLRGMGLTGQGMSNGNAIMDSLVHIIPPDATFADCRIPFRCVAFDTVSGKKHVFKSGNLVTAIRASMAIPSTFTPVQIDGMNLIDGALGDVAPIEDLKDMGFKRTLLSATCQKDKFTLDKKYNFMTGLTYYWPKGLATALTQERARYAKLVIWNNMDFLDSLHFWKAKEAIRKGELSSEKIIEELKRL